MKKIKIILCSIFFALAVYLVWYYFLAPQNKAVVLERASPKSTYTIVAFGDSLTAGYGLPLYESYPYQLGEKLKSKGLPIQVINAGVSGETSKGNNERADFIKEQNPDMVILGIGGNDALRALSVSEMKSNIESTIQILQSAESKPKILLLEMQSPLNAGFAYKKEFDRVYKDVSKKYNLPLIPFLVAKVFLDPDLMLEDRIHPNKAGYAKLVEDNIFDTVYAEYKAAVVRN